MKRVILNNTSLKGILTLTVFTFGLLSCQKESLSDQSDIIDLNTPIEMLAVNSSSGVTSFNLAGVSATFDSTADLTADEIEFLFAVREDEKIAKDLYLSFYNKFQLKSFENLANGEANHIKAVERLFDYYEIEYPVLGEIGVFEDAARQTQFSSMLALGTSGLGAFKVMAQLEESNIVQYGEVIKTIVNPNIKRVMENMAKASANHFKAAIRQITALGGVYERSVLSQAEYDAIIASGFEKGKRYMYKNNGQIANTGKKFGQTGEKRGAVNKNGVCTSTSNGSAPGSQNGSGTQGRGYRGGKA